MLFFLGTHRPNWLGLTEVPLFVSHRTLSLRRGLPRARGPWALDSGAFSELSAYGEWRTTETAYVTAVRRYQSEIGNLQWAAPMDWMCEPHILALTQLSVAEHQWLTTVNYLRLRESGLPFIPVLQGWTLEDYQRHVDQYDRMGVDLKGQLVGVGSVCRRQHTEEIQTILFSLLAQGIRPHGFGVKVLGLRAFGGCLTSADSLAWSYNARMNKPLPGHQHKNCANCLEWALAWRERILSP